MITSRSTKIASIILAVIIVVCIVIALIIYLAAKSGHSKETKGAITTNGHECAQIGASILEKGGNAVDAAIASLFCEGVAMPQSMGLGGGFLMTIYHKESGRVESLNCREMAPAAATENMFHGDQEKATRGGLAVAIPGELRGYWEVYRKYGGKVPWKDLVQPTIDLCKGGILVTEYLAGVFKSNFDHLYKDAGLREAFIDKTTNETYRTNQYMKRLKLAKTLEIIAQEGGDALNNGSLTEQFARDIKEAGGIITSEDLRNYRPEWQKPIRIELPFNETLYTSPLPGSGLILGFIMNILRDFLDYSQPESITNYQRIVESFKFGYGRRTELGDSDYLDISQLINNLTSLQYAEGIRKQINDTTTSQDPTHYGANVTLIEDHGTAHISVLAPNGDAVSVTSTINLYFGAAFMSPSTGIILNDEMDDFSSPNLNSSFKIPPSQANYIKPLKRPLSSMCPSIILKNGDVRLVVGAAGGTKITTSVALTIIKHLWYNMTLQTSVVDKRLHHQLYPMEIVFEQPFNESMDIVNALSKIGHNYLFSDAKGFSAVTAISRQGPSISAATDTRRPGSHAYVY